jgi:tetratricopeptide (TPR) repeat protein
MNQDDCQLRGLYLAFFSGVILLIFLWTGHGGVIVLGLFLVPILGFGLPLFMNLMSKTFVSLIYGFQSSELSYETGSYEDDMDKAKRLVREERWKEAIRAYREIIKAAPKKVEPRFTLARIYMRAGYLSLAMNQYHKILDLKTWIGPNHALVFESERAISELRGLLSAKRDDAKCLESSLLPKDSPV